MSLERRVIVEDEKERAKRWGREKRGTVEETIEENVEEEDG